MSTETLEDKAARLTTAAIAPGAVAVAGDHGVRIVVDVLGQLVCDCPAGRHRQECSHVIAATHQRRDTMPTDSTDLEPATTGERLPTSQTPGRRLQGIPPRLRELGRVRLGEQVDTGNGGTRPKALDKFRLTSPQRQLIEAAAGMYGGRPGQWTPPDGPTQSEVVIEADTLPVAFPPGVVALDQAFELWSGGGCRRRCDGVTEELTDAPCMCPSDGAERAELASQGEACAPTSRLNVVLPELPDLGTWRLESHGFYAASELAGTAALLHRITATGTIVRAQLRIDRRSVKRPNQARRDYVVPVLELPITPGELFAQAATPQLSTGDGDQPALGASAGEPTELEQPPTGGRDRAELAEELLRRIADHGVSDAAVAALLEARFDAEHIDQLTDEQLEWLDQRTSDPSGHGLDALAAAAAEELDQRVPF